ncbi:THUMP-like domain-containing protein [Neotamlana laminarinivorans]|uniref:Class I SAM-dependent methyltransferase n=1 Tax=Neotamlana laminarinivorans TaxID=2883124 RepID=A0A9X1L2T6_9FLAO|nr:class I SAM-dependent methyltransferase [Tamlana laminarinivorans]MCB4800113.1 class I SAM-dependent methyltransferase [Tamlana laminarinivorans]
MNLSILNTEIQNYIDENLNADINTLLLKGNNFETVATKAIIGQIEAKKRCQKKLPTWFETKNIYYPDKLNIEQTSSEISAKYKASLISGKSIIDLTGGFGVDCFYFSKKFDVVTHCEINENLSKIVNHNYKQLSIPNVQTKNVNGVDYLSNIDTNFDWIYIDPSRRHDTKGKVFFLKDCLPNVPEHLNLLFNHSKNILIKTSPLLDISVGLNELKFVKNIHIVAINNEVKELLWELEYGHEASVEIKTVNLKNNKKEHFNFVLNEESDIETIYEAPQTYLYEPNSAILKSGGFNIISKKLKISKLQKHSHLYTSADLIEFPGRTFKIDKVIPYNKKSIKSLGIKKANITTRNFPESVSQIRKKFNLRDGGDIYLFFTTDALGNKLMLLTQKI